MTWRTWCAHLDHWVAYVAVMDALHDEPSLLRHLAPSRLRYSKKSRQVRYGLGVLAIDAANDAYPDSEAWAERRRQARAEVGGRA
jgi:hypothetical protein